MKVAIIDYGMGNLNSVKRAFEECGAKPFIALGPAELSTATHIVLPGVGAFDNGMKMITEKGWIPAIYENVRFGIPLIGICLGMQLLAEWGNEGQRTKGLGLIPGEVVHLETTIEERIPHVGWNEVHQLQPNLLFNGIKDSTDFYFVHSYHFDVADKNDAIGMTDYCGGFVSAICKKNVFGIQFHPEKSQKAGFQLIRNFLNFQGGAAC